MSGGSAKGVTAAISAIVDPSISRPRQNLLCSRVPYWCHLSRPWCQIYAGELDFASTVVVHATAERMFMQCALPRRRGCTHMVVKPMMYRSISAATSALVSAQTSRQCEG